MVHKMQMILEYFAKQFRKILFLLLANLHFQINISWLLLQLSPMAMKIIYMFLLRNF